MSMEHKAFEFDWQEFRDQLSTYLNQALETGNTAELTRFIDGNVKLLRDPNTGRSLERDWDKSVTVKDAHQYGDIALTKFYNPNQDMGLEYEWEEVQEHLKDLDVDPTIILGSPFGPTKNHFDPGKMGSYFQTPDQVAKHLQILERLSEDDGLDGSIAMFRKAFKTAKGLYITF